MFGLAPRAKTISHRDPRAQSVSLLPDAGGAALVRHVIAAGGPAAITLPAPARYLLAAVRSTRVPVVLSRDAGQYLCNYLCWRAAETAAKPPGPISRPSSMCPWSGAGRFHLPARKSAALAPADLTRAGSRYSGRDRRFSTALTSQAAKMAAMPIDRRVCSLGSGAAVFAMSAKRRVIVGLRPRRRAIRRAAGRRGRQSAPAARHRPGGAQPCAADARARRLPRGRPQAAGRRQLFRRARRNSPDPDARAVAFIRRARRHRLAQRPHARRRRPDAAARSRPGALR